jgi:hypothetical protein
MSESVNVEAGGNSTAPQSQPVSSWDELDVSSNTQTTPTEAPEESENTASHDADSESDKEPAETKGEDEPKVSEDKKELAKKELEKKVEPPKDKVQPGVPKSFKFKAGDKEFDLPAEAQLTFPIDGKPASVSIADLQKNYSGKVVWEKRFQELDADKKTFTKEKVKYESDLKTTDEAIGKLVTLSQQGKPRAAIEYLYEVLGGDPRAGWKQMKESVKAELEKYKDMSPEQIQAIEAQEEADFYKGRDSDRAKMDAKQKDHEAVQQRVTQVLDKTKMTQKEFSELADELRSFASQGKLKAEEITPELIGEYYTGIQREEKISSFLDKISPNIENKSKALLNLREIWEKKTPNLPMRTFKKSPLKCTAKRMQ